jgi:hypothetical protein
MFMTRDFLLETLQKPKYRISLGAPYLFFSSSFWLRLRSRPAFLATNWQGHETELFGWSSEKSYHGWNKVRPSSRLLQRYWLLRGLQRANKSLVQQRCF